MMAAGTWFSASQATGAGLGILATLWYAQSYRRAGGIWRLGLAMNSRAGWMRQQENQQLGIQLDIARTFSPRLRRLAGFGLYRGLIGHIDKCSPEDLLEGTRRPVVGLRARP